MKRLLSLVCCLGACSGSPSTNGKQIDSSGGTWTADGVTVQIPPGALTQAITITETASSTSASDAIGPAILLGPEGQTFALPVQVTVPFNPGQLPAGLTLADVVVETAPRNSTMFTSLGGAAVDGSHVAATTTHFSVFVATAHARQNDAGAGDSGGVVDASNGDSSSCAPSGASCASIPCCSGNCDATSHTCKTPVCGAVGTSCSSNADCCSALCATGVCH
jgi:hypothetical protein